MKRFFVFLLAFAGCGQTFTPAEQMVIDNATRAFPNKSFSAWSYTPDPNDITYGIGAEGNESRDVTIVLLEESGGYQFLGYVHDGELYPNGGGANMKVFDGAGDNVPVRSNLDQDELAAFVKGDRSKQLKLERVNYPRYRELQDERIKAAGL